MSKKDYLQEKYEELNRLKILLDDYPKEYVDNIIKSVSKICDDITEYLEVKKNKPSKKNINSGYTENKTKECSKEEEKKKCEEINEDGERVFTVEELKNFDGKDGNPPYISVNGIVYDLSPVKKWKGGKHYGVLAGQVLTEEYAKCHKDKKNVLDKARVVGRLKDESRNDKVFTKEELRKYDGKDGYPAYVAVDGVVYDVSKIFQWKGGMHYGLIAGQDLTAYFEGCHSDNKDIIKNAKRVGILQESNQTRATTYTLKELAKFDGANDTLAYVAIRGIIYDVTGVKNWNNGKHYGLMAGRDLTEFFNMCHKDEEEILGRLRVVGTLKD